MAGLIGDNQMALGNLAGGLNAGIQAFQAQRDRAFDKKVKLAELASKGYQVNPETDDLELNEAGETQKKLGLLKSQDELASYDPNSPVAEGLRKVNQGLLKQGGISDLDLSGMSASQMKNFVDPQIDTSAKFASARAQKEAARAALGDKQSAKRFSDLDSALDPNKSRTGQFGKHQAVIDNADKLLVLKEQNPSLNLDSRQMEELAIGAANLLSTGGQTAQSTIHNLLPKTAQGDVNKLKEWLTNNPTGTEQRAFAERLLETAQREKDLAQNKADGIRLSRIAQYADLEKQNPDAFNAVLQSKGIDPMVWQKYKESGYKQAAREPVTPGGLLNQKQPMTPEARKAIEDQLRAAGVQF